MNDISSEIIPREIIPREIVQLTEPYVIPGALALVVIAALAVYLNRKRIRNRWLHKKTRRCLKRLGLKQLKDIRWPDGLGHYFVIDRLILRHDGITLLMLKPYPGKLFCSENLDYWTQMLGHKSYRFKNPLYELNNQIKAISACIPDVPVNGFLYFDSQAEFPKGHPDSVIHYNKIPDELRRNKKHKVKKNVQSAWNKLKTTIKNR